MKTLKENTIYQVQFENYDYIGQGLFRSGDLFRILDSENAEIWGENDLEEMEWLQMPTEEIYEELQYYSEYEDYKFKLYEIK